MSGLTAEDYESVDRASRALRGQGWREAFTLNEMFEAWADLVADIEHGYDQNIYEYTNDLACRDWLALAWPLLTERVRNARTAELEQLDARFTAATLDDGGRAISRSHGLDDKDAWWWRRRPRRPAGALAADLAGE